MRTRRRTPEGFGSSVLGRDHVAALRTHRRFVGPGQNDERQIPEQKRHPSLPYRPPSAGAHAGSTGNMVALFRAGQSRPAQNRVMPGQAATVYSQYIEKYVFFSQFLKPSIHPLSETHCAGGPSPRRDLLSSTGGRTPNDDDEVADPGRDHGGACGGDGQGAGISERPTTSPHPGAAGPEGGLRDPLGALPQRHPPVWQRQEV